MKKHFASKKIKRGTAIIAVLVIISVSIIYQQHIKKSRNSAAQKILRQIVLSEIASNSECGVGWPCDIRYRYTDGVWESAEEAIASFTNFGFHPDPSVAFHIMRPVAVNGLTQEGFIAFAAHNSIGSTVYVSGAVPGRRVDDIMAARENDVYPTISVNSGAMTLFCYEYDPSNTADPVKKKESIN